MSNPDHSPSPEDRRRAEIISRHLDPAYTAHLESAEPSSPPRSSRTTQSSNASARDQESSLKLQGGDVHRDLYKISARASPSPIQRAQTFSHPQRPSTTETVATQRQPGAFRRNFVLRQRAQSFTAPVTNNCVAFLDLYGSFAGEDLADSDDEDAIEDE